MRDVVRNVVLLRAAVGNVIDQTPVPKHITMPEIHEWLDDILAMLKEVEE